MENLKKILKGKKILISDGAWGTELVNLGLAPGASPEKWNIEKPEIVEKVPLSYVNAGSDIIITNTFGGNKYILSKDKLQEKVYEINLNGVKISKNACNNNVLVFASIGPTGQFIAPLGTVSESEMIDCFSEQVKAFVNADADGIVIESMSDINEALAALKAVKDNSKLSVVVSMTYSKSAKGYATMMGVTPEKAVQSFQKAGADMIGSNCGTGIDEMIGITKIYKENTNLPLWIKPNAGLPELINGKTVYRQTPQYMASKFKNLVEAGADIIGGCCGTTPEHIKLMVNERNKLI